MHPFISIIVPCRNSAKTLNGVLVSIAEQEFKDWELIIADGKSTDDTVALIRAFAAGNSNVKWSSEPDKGTYDAINKAIKAASGQWVIILGSDDRFHNNRVLQEMLPKLQNAKSGFVYGNVKVSGDAGWAKDGEIYGREFPLERLLKHNICQQAVFYRRNLFGEIGLFNTEYPVCADWDFALHCASRMELQYTDHIICDFAAGGASTNVKKEKFFDDFAENMFRYFGKRISRPEFAFMDDQFLKLADAYSNNHSYLKAFRLRRALRKRKTETA